MTINEAYFVRLSIQGTVVGSPKSHSGLNRVSLRVATLSYGATFKDPVIKQRREVLAVELHDEAADKARLFGHGDVIDISNAQLVTRKWRDRRGQEHIRMSIMVDDPKGLECIYAERSSSGPDESPGL